MSKTTALCVRTAIYMACWLASSASDASECLPDANSSSHGPPRGILAELLDHDCGHPLAACGGQSTDPGRPHKPRHDKPGDINRAENPPYRYGMNPWIRSGGADEVGWWAKIASPCKNGVGIVGGGAVHRGRMASPSEGTWGWDYRLRHHPSFSTGWTWWGRSQGGTGAYATDHQAHLKSHE